MAVQFILGRSGTGKTSYCIKAIVDALLEPHSNQPLLLLVPEQATYQAERAILSDKRIVGYSRLNVLSFDRLQFLLLGKNTARPALSRIGQQMLIHRILRDNRDKLKLFGSSTNWPGLGRQIAQTVIELHQYAKTPDDIDRLLGELQNDERNSLSVLKFTDIGLILDEYLKFIEGKYIDPDIQLTRASNSVAQASFVRGAKLWVDGFAGFTASELAMLAELLKAVEDAQIALCLDTAGIDLANPDAESIDSADVFGPTRQTYAALIELTRKRKLELTDPLILDDRIRFNRCAELAHVERNIFEPAAPKLASTGGIRIISAPDARAEVQFVARQIIQLVKEKDYRYRDIAVIASDLERYEHYIRAYFGDYGVRYFIDKQKLLNQHSVVQLICSVLQAVTGGFSSSDIFAYLKTGFVPIERSDVDLLENYCLAFGIDGDDWTTGQDWAFAAEDDGDFDQQRINQIRLKAVGPLLELHERLCPNGSPASVIAAEEFSKAIFDMLENLRVRDRIKRFCDEATDKGDYSVANENKQFYYKLVGLFDELVEVFAGQQLTAQDYLAIISSAFSQLTLALIPPTLDQVLIGSIERSRHPDLKAVFLIGATQKQFPVPVSFDSILTDDDRGSAESAGFTLAPTASQKLAERQYLAYIAFTRPSEFLCITYPVVDEKASAIPRSQFITELESLFENLSEESIAGEPPCLLSKTETGESVHSKTELADLLCSELGSDPLVPEKAEEGRLIALLNDVCSDEQFAELGSSIAAALNYDNRAQLNSKVAAEVFGQRIVSSATQLSTFAACPYRYFARYMLELKQRKEFKLEPLDMGVFYHRVLDAWLKQIRAERRDLTIMDDQELLRLLRQQIERLVTHDSFMSNFARRTAHNTFIISAAGEYLEDCVLAIAEMVRAGQFRPMFSEVSFGAEGGLLGEYRVTLPDARLLSMEGKIDRVDVAEPKGGKSAVIFDYKRSTRAAKFGWSEFYYGLDMQLPIYMLALRSACTRKHKVRDVIGAFYMPVEVKPTTVTFDEVANRTDSFGYKAKGIFNGEFAGQLDREALKDSKYYNFYVKKDGQPYGNYAKRGALEPADFEDVLQFTEQKMVELCEQILSGNIDVKPYRLNGKSPCIFCEYRSVCRFDWQVNDYNFLEPLNKPQVLERIRNG